MTWFKKVMVLAALICLVSAPAFAISGITVETPQAKPWSNGQQMFMVSIAVVQPGATGISEFSLRGAMNDSGIDADFWIDIFTGGLLYEVVTDPGTQPDATYTLAFDCYRGGSLLDIAAASATVTEHVDFSTDLGYNPVFWKDLDITVGDLGSANDATVIEIYIVK